MEERKNLKLRCNSEYRRLYQPMTAQEYEKLESELKNSKNTTVEILKQAGEEAYLIGEVIEGNREVII